MSSCFGSRKKGRSSDTQPLLPHYEDDTYLQRRIHQKIHSYQMVRALSKGYMPSTEQLIITLRTLLASDILSLGNPGLSDSGRLLLKYAKQWLSDFIEILRNKNDGDQIQDFIWFLVRARVSIDAQDIIKTASSTRLKADASAVYQSFKTVGTLLMTNSDFRLFLSDLNIIGRQVLADTANTLSNVAEDAAKRIEPSAEETDIMRHPGSEQGPPPTTEDLSTEAIEVGKVVASGIRQTGKEARDSLTENITGDQKDALILRLKAVVAKLRNRNDYTDSVSTIGLLIQRYAMVYSRAADKTIATVQEDVDANEALDRAVKNGWSLLSSIGDKDAWKELETRISKVMEHSQKDPEFEHLMQEVATSIQKMLTDPNFFESAEQKLDQFKEESHAIGTQSPLRVDIERLIQQARVTFSSVVDDEDVSNMIKTSLKIWRILSPVNTATNPDLFIDMYSVFVPLMIQAIQYIPIPRLEISAPEIDLLLENLILEPGRTINNTSFLPFKLNINTTNDLSIRKAQHRTISSLTTLVTANIQGMSIRADEVGFWLRMHKGLFRLADEGIASFELDDRGIDIAIEFEVGKDRLENILSLREIKVKIHHLSYSLRKSKFACLAWIFKPIIRPIIRKVLERQMATAIANSLRAMNRELLYARERLRATRISDPQDLRTFIKAITTRLTPDDSADLSTNFGVIGGANELGGPFTGVYTPGSIVKLWQDEALQAGERVDENASQGWRNEIFDVQPRAMHQ